MRNDDLTIGPDPAVFGHAPSAADHGGGGFARRLGRKVLDLNDQGSLSHAERHAVRREQAKPAYNRVVRLANDAASDHDMLTDRYEALCVDFHLGVAEEAAVEEIEREMEALRVAERRARAAASRLGEELGIIRDSSGVKLNR